MEFPKTILSKTNSLSLARGKFIHSVLTVILILCSFTSPLLVVHLHDQNIDNFHNQEIVNKSVLSPQNSLKFAEVVLADTPVIISILWTPLEPLVNEPIDVRAIINATHPLTMVFLRYDDGYMWRNLTMSLMGGSPPEYHAALPAIGEAGIIQIEVWALDSNATWGFSGTLNIEIKQGPTTATIPTTTTIPTTSSGIAPMPLVVLLGGIGSLVIIAALIIVQRRKKLAKSLEVGGIEEQLVSDRKGVHALRGAEFIGNILRFKVKVVNNTPNVITDLTVTISSYPKDSLNLEGDISKIVPKIDPQGFRSPSFEFLPTQDCVKGNVVASISYVDHYGEVYSMTTEPYTIRAVCDLLTPESISPEDFELRLTSFDHGEITLKVDDWTPEEMQSKTQKVLETSNFFEVSSETETIHEHIQSRLTGWAKGKYTNKNIGVEITISGLPGVRGATCKIQMSGEDEAMIMPAIDEIGKKLSAWLCPRCGARLPVESVREIKASKSTVCPFCGISLDR